MKIMIDPGHGPGNANKGPTGYYEYAGMWKLSGFLKTALERCGFSADLTRTQESCPDLEQRGTMAKGYDLFLSQHSNASNGAARGCEVFYSVRLAGDQSFAADMAKAVAAVMGNNNRGAKTKPSTIDPADDYFSVISYAAATGCRHVLLCESGFHDNAEDEAILKSDDKLHAIAEAQARVICQYLGKTYQPSTPSTPSVTFSVGDTVRLRDGVATYADGSGIASFVRSATLYVRQLGSGKVLVSTLKTGAVTGWAKTGDLVRADGTAMTPSTPPATPSATPSAAFAVGDRVRIRSGVTQYADGKGIAFCIRMMTLYVRQIGDGQILVSIKQTGDVEGWVKTEDLRKV